MKEVFENYEAFYNMLLSTTIMSNSKTAELDADFKKIIRFIGEAYRLDEKLIDKCEDLILNTLSTLALATDQQAIYSSRRFDDSYSDNDVLFDIKGDVLSKLDSMSKLQNSEINRSWFDYSHYKSYQANVRFAKINIASASGNLVATRQVGILRALGIGCEKNIRESMNRLTQCVYWGDIPAMYYLAYVYGLNGDFDKANTMTELAELSTKYLNEGYTVIPEDDKANYSADACVFYSYVSSIKQDVVYAYNKYDIDFSFVEAIRLDCLDFKKRMHYINNYNQKEWKNLTNGVNFNQKVGF